MPTVRKYKQFLLLVCQSSLQSRYKIGLLLFFKTRR